MKSFLEYIAEAQDKQIVFAFGRFNPPTVGHEKLLDKVASIAKGKTYRIYASQSHDPKKNPLKFEEKIKFMRKMFPRHARSIVADNDVNNALNICSKLYEQGFTHVTMVAGGDRVEEFSTLLNRYNGQKMRDGFYNFKGGVEVVSAGERDPDAEGVSGMSASKMRAAASANDLELFSKGLPSGFDGQEELFNAVRAGMGLKESRNYRKHIQLESVGETREAYVNGDLFKVGDTVVVKESEEVGKINRCGPNYVIVEFSDGTKHRKWLNAVELLEEESVKREVPAAEIPKQVTYRTVSQLRNK
jgi:hypothetical protein